MTLYKVWIHLEAIDKQKDHYQDIEEPHEAGRFSSKQEAHLCIDQMLAQADPCTTAFNITPPPNEDNLFRVVYAIDVNGADPKSAARVAHQTMTAPDTLGPVLHVLDTEGHETTIDLSHD